MSAKQSINPVAGGVWRLYGEYCLLSDNWVITNKWTTFTKFSIININLTNWSLCTNIRSRMTPCKHSRTSMKEIPTLQTSAWIPYCSPDILSGCGAKIKAIKNCKPVIFFFFSRSSLKWFDRRDQAATHCHVCVGSHVCFGNRIHQLQGDQHQN